MLNCREILPAKSWLETQPLIELQASCCQNRFTGPPPFLHNRMCAGWPTCSCKQVPLAPLLFSPSRICAGWPICEPAQQSTQLSTNQMHFRIPRRPIRDNLGSYGYADLERIIYMSILYSQFIINSFTVNTWNKECIGHLCNYTNVGKVNPGLPRT